jgi:hypothetical protein
MICKVIWLLVINELFSITFILPNSLILEVELIGSLIVRIIGYDGEVVVRERGLRVGFGGKLEV